MAFLENIGAEFRAEAGRLHSDLLAAAEKAVLERTYDDTSSVEDVLKEIHRRTSPACHNAYACHVGNFKQVMSLAARHAFTDEQILAYMGLGRPVDAGSIAKT